MSLIPIDEVIHFDVITSTPATSAAVDADSAPTFDVFEEATDTPILDDQAMTKRTSLTGNYRGTFTASAANGFEAGKWYNIVVTAVVGGVTGKCVAKTFRVAPVESSAGVPKADLALWLGAAPNALSSGRVEVLVGAVTAGVIAAASFAANALDAVWVSATRLLTAGTNIVLAKGTGVTGFTDLDEAGVRSAVGLASANLDTQLGDLPTNAELMAAFAAADDAVLSAIATLENLSAADVNAEVDQAIVDAALATAANLALAKTAIDAVKAKTDSLTFSQAGHVDANVQRINDVALLGDGSATPWGPA